MGGGDFVMTPWKKLFRILQGVRIEDENRWFRIISDISPISEKVFFLLLMKSA